MVSRSSAVPCAGNSADADTAISRTNPPSGSSINRRILRGGRVAERVYGVAVINRSPAPYLVQWGYYQFEVRRGLVFVPYGWIHS